MLSARCIRSFQNKYSLEPFPFLSNNYRKTVNIRTRTEIVIVNQIVITCDEIIDAEAKSNNEQTNTIPKNKICETKSFYILLAFLLITTALLIAVRIYCYLMKYKAKQKHLLPFYVTNNELKKVLY